MSVLEGVTPALWLPAAPVQDTDGDGPPLGVEPRLRGLWGGEDGVGVHEGDDGRRTVEVCEEVAAREERREGRARENGDNWNAVLAAPHTARTQKPAVSF